MHFQVHKGDLDADASSSRFTWSLDKKEGRVCCSARDFSTEKEARSDIAAAKKSMKGAGRCKVLSPGEEPS